MNVRADWDPGDDFKMHFPQLPDPEGWDICLVDQYLADDFVCSESGPIRDIHFWISWMNDFEGPVNEETFEVFIFDDAGGRPGVQLWALPPLHPITYRPFYGQGSQGWHCPSFGNTAPNNHQFFHQINITNIQEPFIQEAGSIYWLVIRAHIIPPVDTSVGWKTSVTDPPGPIFGAPAQWSQDLFSWQLIQTPFTTLLLHDLSFVITDTGGPQEEREYGDAPEGAVAYPSLGVTGAFPTCRSVPLAGYIEHSNFGAWFGMGFDFENDGNAGFCPTFTPNRYDQDECFDPATLIDAGLLLPDPFTIVGPVGAETVTPCPNSMGNPLGLACQPGVWGGNIDIWVHNTMPNATVGWVNVLADWNQDGVWGGASQCPGGLVAPEHILVNHPIPNPFVGAPLSALSPPPFLIGPRSGYVWVRFSITEQQVPANWDGSGIFEDGETEDYLLWVEGEEPFDAEFGDAPEGAPAYPWAGVAGAFPTCVNTGPSGFVRHAPSGGAWFGPTLDYELEGNAGLCPTFTPSLYDQDECFQDNDAGLLIPEPFTIQNQLPVPCPPFNGLPLGFPCAPANWGANVDIEVHNHMPNATPGYVNLTIDWNQDGLWGGSLPCPDGTIVPEHVLVNFPIPNPYDGPLAPLTPPAFVIGPQPGYVWARFSITEQPVGLPWDGSGIYEDGESEDYLLRVEEEPLELDWGDLPDPYPTLSAANGPSHVIVPNMALGAGVDSEPDGQPDIGALGDDNDTIYPPPNDDEDGITFVTTLIPGQQAIVDVTNNTINAVNGYLDGWIDFGADGSFAEAGDQVLFAAPLSPAPVNFNSFFINVPFSAQPGPTFARFRISGNPAGYGWTGPAPDGEVEDYAVRIVEAPPIMACCLPDGSCVDSPHMNCVTLGGDPQGPGTTCATTTCHEIKWAQPPIFDPDSAHPECFHGWDEPSIFDGYQVVADDWLCVSDLPVTDIHFWGSYANWEDLAPPPDAPALFHIGLWTDQPAGPGGNPPSHPQTMIWEWIVPRQELNEHPVACDYESEHMQTPDGCFRYDYAIPPHQWFFQEPGETIYWLSIAAIYDPVDCACNADFNNDGAINALDLAFLAACIGQPPTGSCAQMDLTCDGVINTRDADAMTCWINCWAAHADLALCDAMCCLTAPPDVEHVWGWKTRPHFYNDYAQRVANPTELFPGVEYVEGDLVESGWDMAFVITTETPEPPLIPKWSQLPHPEGEGFDARSDIGFVPSTDVYKWSQAPDGAFSGIHAHDDVIIGNYDATTLADQWVCDGGPVVTLVWYGNYELYSNGTEKRNSGVNYFDVAIYDNDMTAPPACLPNIALWSRQPSFATVNETDTGLLNNENCRIYRYTLTLDASDWFDQQPGQTYWLAVGAISNNPNAAAIWRWQNAGPNTVPPTLVPNVCFYASRTTSMPMWSSGQRELSFEIISIEPPPPPEPNRVVADDFISDGRPIEAVRWWGGYIDERFAPLEPVEPYIVDGWFISFHHATPDATCPPDAMAGDDPTALGVYFAPADAVSIVPMGYADCFGHDVYGYAVDLSRCCLLCAEMDPRDGSTPADDDAFNEVRGSSYWIDVQAVAGVQWRTFTVPACTPIYTGHIPSDLAALEGHFWGWHTSPGPVAPCSPMNDACYGFVSAPSVTIPPNDCPDYSDWRKQPWECDTPEQSVQMAFELLTTTPDACATCPGDMDGNNVIDGRDIQAFVQCLLSGGLPWNQCACADVDCSRTVTLADIDAFVALLLSGVSC